MNKFFIVFLFLSNTVYSQTLAKKAINDTVYVNPEFPGGAAEMFKFIGKNLKYPAKPRDNGIMGTLYVGFVIDSIGKIENPIIKAQKLYRMKKKNIFSKPEMEIIETDIDLATECLRFLPINLNISATPPGNSGFT